jgi:hypothetical protein
MLRLRLAGAMTGPGGERTAQGRTPSADSVCSKERRAARRLPMRSFVPRGLGVWVR